MKPVLRLFALAACLIAAPARYVRHARTRTLKFSTTWPWAHDLVTAWALLHALHPA